MSSGGSGGIGARVLRSLAAGALVVPLATHAVKRGLAAAVGPPYSMLVRAAPTAVLAPLVQVAIAGAVQRGGGA